MVVLCGLCSPLVRCLSALPKRAVHVYTFTERLHHCTSLTLMFGTQATKKEEDRVGGDQGIRVPEEVVDEFPNFEVGVFMFLKTAVPNAWCRSSQDAATTTHPLGPHTL